MDTFIIESDDTKVYRENVISAQHEGYRVAFADIKDNTYRAIMVNDRQDVEYTAWDKEKHKGKFIRWVNEADESKDGNMQWTMGLIENEDGELVTVAPTKIKFIRS